MKQIFILIMTSVLLLLSCQTNATSIDNNHFVFKDLYYGMEQDSINGCYLLRDTLLESIPSVTKQECTAVWYHTDDEYEKEAGYKFNVSLGLYLDKEWASAKIQKAIEEEISESLIGYLSYYCTEMYEGHSVNIDSLRDTRKKSRPKTTEELFNYSKIVFNAFKEKYLNVKDDSLYFKIPESRICFIAHKIYENAKYATYIIEETYDYNGSCGCNSRANYYTFDKLTGKVLSPKQILNNERRSSVLRNMKSILESNKEEYRWYRSETDMNELFNSLSGAAIIEEGILLYYLPYTVGCGADGESVLIIE